MTGTDPQNDHARAMEGGFDDAVRQSQSVFRSLLNAMAHPGTLQGVAAECDPPAPLADLAGALALTLCDADTPIWLDRPLVRVPGVSHWISMQTGGLIVELAPEAQFAFVAEPERMPPLEGFALGSQDYPDRSTTIIMQLPSLTKGRPLTLAGPGIESVSTIKPAGLPTHFLQQWQANRNRFPRGIDAVLVAPEGLVALPRTVVIQSREN